MKVVFYRTGEDALNHIESTEQILWLDGFATESGNSVTFKRALDGKEVSIPFANLISVVSEEGGNQRPLPDFLALDADNQANASAKNQPTDYRIPLIWEMYGHCNVEAVSLGEAIKIALAPETPLPDGDYVDESVRVDYDVLKLDSPATQPKPEVK